MARLVEHGQERHAPADGQLLRYANGRPITSRRYDHLWARLGRELSWVATEGISTHWIRHTILTWVERTRLRRGPRVRRSHRQRERGRGHGDVRARLTWPKWPPRWPRWPASLVPRSPRRKGGDWHGCCHHRRAPRHGPESAWFGPGADRRTRRRGPVPATAKPGRTVRSWPLLVLAAPAAAEVWSGWVGIAQMTGFGLVRPLPGIWPSLRLDTAITLPIGVEAYAAYALRAWLARDRTISARTCRFAKWSAIWLRARDGRAGRLPPDGPSRDATGAWAITTVVSCLPVLVLGMGTALAHMLRADAEAMDAPDDGTGHWPPCGPCPAPPRTRAGQTARDRRRTGTGPRAGTGPARRLDRSAAAESRDLISAAAPQVDQARVVARRLAAAGNPVSRRALRSGGVRGSNEALNALARILNGEMAGAAPSRAPAG